MNKRVTTRTTRIPRYRLHKATGQAFVEIRGKRHYLGRHDSAQARQKYDRLIAALEAAPESGSVPTSKRPTRLPSFRVHAQSGQAFVEIRGKRHYLGPHKSPAAREKYHRVVAELVGTADPAQAADAARGEITRSLNEVLLAYWHHAQQYYPKHEQQKMWAALEPVMRLFGSTDAAQFGPLALKAVRKLMIDTPNARGTSNCRTYINDQVHRIRRIFKWAVAEELVPPHVLDALKAVEGLKRGRQYGATAMRETEPIKPIDEEHVRELLPWLAPPVAAMVELQLLTGMRSQNVTSLRACEIDMTGSVWVYTPPQHKNKHRGHELPIALGPQAQAIIRRFWTPEVDAYLFRPIDAEDWRSRRRRAERKTPLTPSQRKRKKSRKPRKAPGERYDTHSYRRAIEYAFVRIAASRGHAPPKGTRATKKWLKSVSVVVWHPHQLRHTFGTRVRKQYGFEAAQNALGHKDPNATKIYAEANFEGTKNIAREIG